MHRKIVLASSSPRRHQILTDIGLSFEIDPTREYEETNPADEAPEETIMRHAKGKASEVAKRHENAIVIGVDTMGTMDGHSLGKPKTHEDAFRMLKLLQDRSHEVITGICIIDTKTGKELVKHEITEIDFCPLTTEEIENYLGHDESMDKAAAYGIQGKGALLVSSIKGDYFNVVGLPLGLLSKMLKDFDINLMDIVK